MTWSPVFRCAGAVGLCLPFRILATLLARRPSGTPVASTTYQSPWRSSLRAVQVLNLLTFVATMCLVHQLDEDHRRRVAQPWALLDDPRVAPRPIAQPGHEVAEQLV